MLYKYKNKDEPANDTSADNISVSDNELHIFSISHHHF